MDLKKSVIIVISLIVILTFFNFLEYTGKITSSYGVQKFKGSISIMPYIALQDETITINIQGPYYKDGKKSSYSELSNKIYFYRNGLRKDEKKICIKSRCKGNFTEEFTIPAKMYSDSEWQEGTYIAKIYDYLNKEYIEATFIVTNKTDQRIGCKEIGDLGDDIYHKAETTSHYTGKEITKEDICLDDGKTIIEYYCCKTTDTDYKNTLGMCQRYAKCINKCYKGACFS